MQQNFDEISEYELETALKEVNPSSRTIWPFGNNEVIFIPKSGKDSYLKTSSYRPITKSSYVGKLLERMLKNRIMHYLHSNDLDDVRQEGFRKRKSTARYITDLINNIQLAWASNENPVAVSGFGESIRQCLGRRAIVETLFSRYHWKNLVFD